MYTEDTKGQQQTNSVLCCHSLNTNSVAKAGSQSVQGQTVSTQHFAWVFNLHVVIIYTGLQSIRGYTLRVVTIYTGLQSTRGYNINGVTLYMGLQSTQVYNLHGVTI